MAPRRSELIAALSIAIDLGLGQPAEHVLRSSLMATRLADVLGLTREQRDTAYFTTMVLWIGCHADSHEYVQWFGDDITVKQQAYLVDWSGLPYMRFLMGNLATGSPLPDRLRTVVRLMRNPRGQMGALVHSHCASASLLAAQIGLPARVQVALAATFERYDGKGGPDGVEGEAVPIETVIAQLVDVAEVHDRVHGRDGVVQMVRARRGGQFHPDVADAFLANIGAIMEPADHWPACLAQAPTEAPLTESELDEILIAIGDFVDLKCPFTLGHSRAVASLATRAAEYLGLPASDVRDVRRAAHVHDIGRIGVSNRLWESPGPLSTSDWERARLHPYLTARVMGRVEGLADVASIASNHHEQPDGGGYPRGLSGTALPFPDRLLAAAVAYESALEPRPYRVGLTAAEAATRLQERAASGALDTRAVHAVLAVLGHRTTRPTAAHGLTPREAEILVHVARGESNREIAERLVLSQKTVRNHVERIYTKIGVSNRVGASLFALHHGLADG